MLTKHVLILAAAAASLSACVSKVDKTVDRGIDSHHLSEMQAGIWIDPNGCDHWIIDDGFEGYMDARIDRRGHPVCSGIGQPGDVVGPFKNGVADPI